MTPGVFSSDSVKLLSSKSTVACTTGIGNKYASWKDMPSFCLLCSIDRNIALQQQHELKTIKQIIAIIIEKIKDFLVKKRHEENGKNIRYLHHALLSVSISNPFPNPASTAHTESDGTQHEVQLTNFDTFDFI